MDALSITALGLLLDILVIPVIVFIARMWYTSKINADKLVAVESSIEKLFEEAKEYVDEEELSKLEAKVNHHQDIEGKQVLERLAKIETILDFISKRLERMENKSV